MNINDSRDALLFEIIEKYDATINTFLKAYKRKDGEIKHRLNFRYTGFWLYLIALFSYLTCFIPCIFHNNLIYTILVLIGTLLLSILNSYEGHLPQKQIFHKTSVDYKKANLYDLFNVNVGNICSDRLKFSLKYIKYLTTNDIKINNYIGMFSFFIGFTINIITGNIGNKSDEYYYLNLSKSLFISFTIIYVINIIIGLLQYKKTKLIKIKKYIENVLLFRNAEKIKNSS